MRNYAASENPPRHWKPKRQDALRGAIGHPPDAKYIPLWRLSQTERRVLIESVERFNRLHIGA